MASRPIITLTTDFGTRDEYVGAMKGAILSRSPLANIIDITHEIEPQNILRAAYIVPAACCYFPEGAIHVIVVDPGVGSTRRIVLLVTPRHLYLAPDNGVLTRVIEEEALLAAYEIRCKELFLKPVSNTFHGRDIFAPVAAALADGLSPNQTGPPLPLDNLVRLSLPKAEVNLKESTITGSIVLIDHFGNMMTNIHRKDLVRLAGNNFSALTVLIKGHRITGLKNSYSQGEPGMPLAILGSRDYLELAIYGGNGARQLDLLCNDIIRVIHSL